jgi:FAD/FMN-containing dehydrogenase
MIRGLTVAFGILASLTANAAVVDRMAVIVGTHVVKTSDIQRELRVSSFLNRQALDESSPAMHRAAERLIDQELVRDDLLKGQYAQPTEKDAAAFLQQLKHDRFGGSEARFRAELAQHHLTEDQLRRQLLWQLTVLRFIDQRFRPGVLVTDEEVASYYREHRAELQRTNPRNNSLEDLTPEIRETLTGERINQAFEEWLKETRGNTRIEYRPQAFNGSTQ